MKTRKKGYYWVKIDYNWEPAEWNGVYWYRCGNEQEYLDHDFQAIDERILRPSASVIVE